MESSEYHAFISYSRKDARAATRLHRFIENYSPPRGLLPDAAPRKPLRPLFRDRDELIASASLADSIQQALTQSRCLVVLCSPEAAQSEWVNQEIIGFKRCHPQGLVLPVILRGEPNASLGGDRADQECFPPALLHKLGPDGELGSERVEPLAADMRREGDGIRLARLKLVAALLDVNLDDLIQRDAHRRVRVLSSVAAAACLGVVVFAWMAYTAMVASGQALAAQQVAEDRRMASEDLVEFMLTDMRKRLEPVGRLDVMDAIAEKALSYYDAQPLGSADSESLGRRARAQHLIGETYAIRGDIDEATEVFDSAAETTTLLLRLQSDNADRLFEHAQSMFWLGYVAWQQGNISEAYKYCREYLQMATRMVELEPEREDWQVELQYAHSNLGTLAFEQKDWEIAERSFLEAQELGRQLLESSPGDAARQRDLAEGYSWLASTYLESMQFRLAKEYNERELASYEKILASDPNNRVVQDRVLTARRTRAGIALALGESDLARAELVRANDSARELLALEPESTNSMTHLAEIHRARAEHYLFRGEREQAARFFNLCHQQASELVALDGSILHWQTDMLYQCAFNLAALERQQSAEQSLQSLSQLQQQLQVGPGDAVSLFYLQAQIALTRGDIRAGQGQLESATKHWRHANELLRQHQEKLDPRQITLLAISFTRLEKIGQAQALLQTLEHAGYQHPEFVLVWQELQGG